MNKKVNNLFFIINVFSNVFVLDFSFGSGILRHLFLFKVGVNSIIVGLADGGESSLLWLLSQVKQKLFILHVVSCEVVSKFRVLGKQELICCALLELVFKSVLDSSEFLNSLSQRGLCLFVSLFVLQWAFSIILGFLLLEFRNFAFTNFIQILQFQSEKSFLIALENFISFFGVGEIVLWNHLHVKSFVVFDEFLFFPSEPVRFYFQQRASSGHRGLIVFGFSCCRLFVIQFFCQKGYFDFRWSQ